MPVESSLPVVSRSSLLISILSLVIVVLVICLVSAWFMKAPAEISKPEEVKKIKTTFLFLMAWPFNIISRSTNLRN